MKYVWWVLILTVVAQIVPFGHTHSNPPVTKEPPWDSPSTANLFHRACYDCHSNETGWPWYSNVAPVSWLVQHDVDSGRRHLNLSEWDKQQKHADHVAQEVKQGDMPLWYYLPMHPLARLSEADKQAVEAGAEKSLGPQSGPGEREHDR
jgi:hypothetical protein